MTKRNLSDRVGKSFLFLITLFLFPALLAQTPPPQGRGTESGEKKATQQDLTAEDRESVLQLKSRMDDAFRIQKEAEKRQADLVQELQQLLLKLSKKCGGAVGLTPEKHEVVCQKPEPPKKE